MVGIIGGMTEPREPQAVRIEPENTKLARMPASAKKPLKALMLAINLDPQVLRLSSSLAFVPIDC